MKIRTGFVANSSSSSFIIGCKAVPTTVEEAGNIWFGNKSVYVAPIIIDRLFNGLKVVDINFDSLMEKAKSIKNVNRFYHRIPRNEDGDVIDIEWSILQEISSEFYYKTKYGYSECYSNDTQTPFEIYEKKTLKKLMEKSYPDAKTEDDIPWYKREVAVDKWFARKSIREKFIEEVNYFIKDLKGYSADKNTVFMIGEFGDDLDYGLVEHGDHWDKFSSCVKFSHR